MTIVQMAQTVCACSKQIRKPVKVSNAAMKHAKAVFNDLSNDNLLMRCLHGKIQNQKLIVEWDDLEAHDKNIFHQI